jgi:Na+/melibiose symporter-like transporter
MIMFVMVVYKIQKIKRKESLSSNTQKRHKKWTFYSIVFMCMGFWRIPGIFYFYYTATGLEVPSWSQVLLLIFFSTEGLVVCVVFGWYFDLFRKCAARCGLASIPESSSTETTETDSKTFEVQVQQPSNEPTTKME